MHDVETTHTVSVMIGNNAVETPVACADPPRAVAVPLMNIIKYESR